MEILWDLQDMQILAWRLGEITIELTVIGFLIIAYGAICFRDPYASGKVKCLAIMAMAIGTAVSVFAVAIGGANPSPEYIVSKYAPKGSVLVETKSDGTPIIKFEGVEYGISKFHEYRLYKMEHAGKPKVIADLGPYEKIQKDGKPYLRRKSDGYYYEIPPKAERK